MKIPKSVLCTLLSLASFCPLAQTIDVDGDYDFGDIELGLKSFTCIKIRNKGSTDLTISSITLTAVLGPPNQWGIDDRPMIITPRGEGCVKIEFAPNQTPPFPSSADLTISYPTGSTTVHLFANVVPFTQLNTILLVDRSASMARDAYRYQSGSPGSATTSVKSKIDAAMTVAGDYLNIVKAWSGSKLGMIEFNRNTFVALPYDYVTAATTFPPNPTTSDGSDFRKAFQNAWSLFGYAPSPPPPVVEKNIIILISDGVELSGTGLLDQIQNNRDDRTHPPLRSDAKIYCIGVGKDSDVQKLRAISLASGVHDGYGYYSVDSDLSQNASDFFYRIWAHAKGYSTVNEDGK